MHGKNCISLGIALGMILGIVFGNRALGSLVGVGFVMIVRSAVVSKNIKSDSTES